MPTQHVQDNPQGIILSHAGATAALAGYSYSIIINLILVLMFIEPDHVHYVFLRGIISDNSYS